MALAMLSYFILGVVGLGVVALIVIHEVNRNVERTWSTCLFYYRQIEEQGARIESILEANQKDKLKFYVDKPRPRAAAMDYEASQRATLEEFKEQ